MVYGWPSCVVLTSNEMGRKYERESTTELLCPRIMLPCFVNKMKRQYVSQTVYKGRIDFTPALVPATDNISVSRCSLLFGVTSVLSILQYEWNARGVSSVLIVT